MERHSSLEQRSMQVANVERCLDLVEALAAQPDGAPLGELADALALPKSAAHRLLQALTARGYVIQDADTQDYRLSLKFVALAFRHLDTGRLPDAAQAVLDRLARDSGEYCRLALIEGERLLWTARAQGATQGLRYDPAMDGEVVLHATATGKAWLASLPEEEALALVYRRGFSTPPGFGPRVVRTIDELRAQLADTRTRGYALAIDEGESGTLAVATVFRAFDAPDAPVAGTLSIAGPRARIDDERAKALAKLLPDAASELAALWPLRRRQRAGAPSRVAAEAA
jgi:DNA-binding IclR family transcriptional regulator